MLGLFLFPLGIQLLQVFNLLKTLFFYFFKHIAMSNIIQLYKAARFIVHLFYSYRKIYLQFFEQNLCI